MSLLTILYWVILVLSLIGWFAPPTWPHGIYIRGGSAVALFIIIGLRVFRTAVQVVAIGFILGGMVTLTGCMSATNRNIVAVKSTVLGFDVSSDPQSQIPHVRLGLVRNFYQVIPVAIATSNNAASVQTPNYATSMAADMGLTSQQGAEEFATGNAADLQTKANTTAQIGAAKLRGTALVLTPSTIAANVPAVLPLVTNAVPVITGTNAP
jgi:hypothetical protein